jgi:hypothetical protein
MGNKFTEVDHINFKKLYFIAVGFVLPAILGDVFVHASPEQSCTNYAVQSVGKVRTYNRENSTVSAATQEAKNLRFIKSLFLDCLQGAANFALQSHGETRDRLIEHFAGIYSNYAVTAEQNYRFIDEQIAAAKIFIKPNGCFSLNGHKRFSKSDLESVEKKIIAQARELRQFLAEFYSIAGNGAAWSSFYISNIIFCDGGNQEVENKPIDFDKNNLIFKNKDSKILTAEEIKKYWDRGDHLSRQSLFQTILSYFGGEDIPFAEKAISKYWYFINPIGDFRFTLRKNLNKLALKQKNKLGVRKNLSPLAFADLPPNLSTDEISKIKQYALLLLENSKLKQSTELSSNIKNMTDNEFKALHGSWVGKLNAETGMGILDSLIQVKFNQSIEIDVKRSGYAFVSVTNWHAIFARAAFGNQGSSQNFEGALFQEFLKIMAVQNLENAPRVSINHEDSQSAVIKVDTFDYIEAQLTLDFKSISKQIENNLSLAALLAALDEII